MTTGSGNLSCKFGTANHTATITVDDAAFPCELQDRVNGRTQTVLRGILKGKGYKTGGVPCNLALITSPGRFPIGNHRVIMELDSTGTYYAVYDHTNKTLKIYSLLGTEVVNGIDISALEFPFMAVGE